MINRRKGHREAGIRSSEFGKVKQSKAKQSKAKIKAFTTEAQRHREKQSEKRRFEPQIKADKSR